jgi:hypothetical protein
MNDVVLVGFEKKQQEEEEEEEEQLFGIERECGSS